MSSLPSNRPSAGSCEGYRIVINQAAFLQVVLRLLLAGGTMAVGPVRRRNAGPLQEFVLESWEIYQSTPTGGERPPLFDWAVLATTQATRPNLEALLLEIAPKQSQRVIAILLDAENHSRVHAAVWHNRWTFPQEILFIGPGMLHLSQPTLRSSAEAVELENSAAISPVELRASRTQGALPDLYPWLSSDQGRRVHAIVVGAGGGGQELMRLLVASGLRWLTIIDGDHLGFENLDRMTLAQPSQVGQAKVLQVARALHRQQPALNITALPKPVQDPDVVRFMHGTRADVIFSFLDTDVGRLATSLLAREMHAVHVDVGTLIRRLESAGATQRVMSADIRLFAPGGHGCVACVPPMSDLETVLYHLSAPPGCLQRGQPQPWNAIRAGSLLHLNQLAAALALETWFGWVQGNIQTSTWTRVHWEGLVPQIASAAVGRGDQCRFCSPRRD